MSPTADLLKKLELTEYETHRLHPAIAPFRPEHRVRLQAVAFPEATNGGPAALQLLRASAPEVAMRRGLLLAALLWTLPTFSAYADPIRITGGTLEMSGPELVGNSLGILEVFGFGGFHMIASGDAHNGFGHECMPCGPADTLSMSGSLQAGGISTITGGRIPTNPAWRLDQQWGFHFEASPATVIVPPLDTTAVFTARFVFMGPLQFHRTDVFPPRDLYFDLFGTGRGTVELHRRPDDPAVWNFAGAHYEFDPVPEPATLLLVGSGLAGVMWRRRSRTRRA